MRVCRCRPSGPSMAATRPVAVLMAWLEPVVRARPPRPVARASSSRSASRSARRASSRPMSDQSSASVSSCSRSRSPLWPDQPQPARNWDAGGRGAAHGTRRPPLAAPVPRAGHATTGHRGARRSRGPGCGAGRPAPGPGPTARRRPRERPPRRTRQRSSNSIVNPWPVCSTRSTRTWPGRGCPSARRARSSPAVAAWTRQCGTSGVTTAGTP